jgi:Cu(I)/Ag(I) efflux system membrane fusion protein
MDKPFSSTVIAAGIVSLGLATLVWDVVAHPSRYSDLHAAAPTMSSTPSTDVTRPAVSVPSVGADLVRSIEVPIKPLADELLINGKLALNAMRVQQVSSRLAGRLDRIDVFEGAIVSKGQTIGLLYSPDFISAEQEFLLARSTLRTLASNPATKDLQDDAAATLASARNKLRVLGATDGEIEQLDRSGLVQQHLVMHSPIAGRVIKRNIDPGAYLNAGDSFGTVADLSSLWFIGNVYESQLPRIRQGAEVTISVDGSGLPPIAGRISFVGALVDPTTHTLPVRVEVANANGVLKPEMFARARVRLGVVSFPTLPRRAVIQDGADAYVVIDRGQGKLERVAVEFRDSSDDSEVAITKGVSAGDRVVVDGSVIAEKEVVNQQRWQNGTRPVGKM